MAIRNLLVTNLARLRIKVALDKLILTDSDLPVTIEVFLHEMDIGIDIADERSNFLTNEERLKEAHLLKQNIHLIRLAPDEIRTDPMACVLHVLELAHLWRKL